MYLRPMGDDTVVAPTTTSSSAPAVAPAPSFNLGDAINSEPVSTAAAIALTYHGYRRTGSLIWALVYGAVGKWKPVYAVPVALAQGYAQKKPCP